MINSLTIKVYIAPGYNAQQGKLILNNVEYPFDNVMPGSDNDYEYYFGFANPVSLPVTGQLFITDASDDIVPFNHNGTIQVNQGYGIWNYDYNNPCYMEFELEQDGQSYGDPSIEFGSVSFPWYYNQYAVSDCNTPSTHTVTLSCDGSKGRVCYSTDGTTWSTPLISTSTTVNHGDTIYIKANPETGYQFQKWSDDSTSNPNTLTVAGDETLSAVFVATPSTYTVTVITDTAVLTATGGGTYNSGASCTLTATVIDPMCEFDDWYDGSSVLSTSNPYTFTVTGNVTIYGRWKEAQPPVETYTVTVNVQGPGTTSGAGSYTEFTTATLTATPDPDSQFIYWYDNDNDQAYYDNPWSFTVDRDWDVDAIFAGQPPTQYYTISGSISGQGTISGTGTYEEGMEVNLTATPASGWEFDHWYDNDNYRDYYDNPFEFEIYRDWDITAVFEDHTPPTETYAVRVNVTGQGGVTGAGDYQEGAQVTLTASPSTGYEFSSWQINGTVVETNSTYQFTMGNQDVTVTAVFEEEAEKHIYLCDNSGAHLAEMTKTGSTWNVTGAFTSGMYSIRATVEDEYEDAWFKFYQTSGDNRIFVGAGDDPSFEDIGTYIVIDDILTSFSLVEDQTTGYYVVNYQNTDAMTVSMVDNIVNSYIGDFVTASDIAEMGYTTAADISSMSYITMTDVESCGYIDQTTLSSMAYIDQTSLSSMSYITMTDVQGLGYIDQTTLSNMSYVDTTTLSNMAYIDQTTLNSMSYVDQTSLSSMGYMTQTDISAMSYVDSTALSNMAYIDQTSLSSMGYTTVADISSMGYTTVADISSMSYVDQTSLSSMGYMTQTDISSMSYITMTDVQGLGYIDQASLSAMSYVDNSYLGSYMNAVVGDINSILQTI